MKFTELNCISENVNLDDYLKLYNYVRNNMEHPEWLGTFTKDEIIEILSFGGRIWLYHNENDLVCSMFYISPSQNSLIKHNVNTDEKETGALGPIMVNPNYIGNGFQLEMMNIFNEYCKSIGKKYIFTKAHSDNIYSINNLNKDKYVLTHEYENERGKMSAYLKRLDW